MSYDRPSRGAGGYGRNNRGGGRFGRDRPPREMHKATCAECGKECEVPFKPNGQKPVYCDECFQNHKPERSDRGGGRFGGRGGGGYGGNRGGGRFGRDRDGGRGGGRFGGNRGGGRFGRDRPPREMHKATCAECGKECEVPFKPNGQKPVYCDECFQNHKPERSDRGRY